MALDSPISFRYSADRFIPCDSVDITFACERKPDSFCEIAASLDGILFFDGIVDRQVFSCSKNGKLLTLSCRSKACMLVDNEVKPYIYFQLTSSQLFERYAKPLGVLSHKFPFEAKKNFIQVKKGMSSWNMIEEFCRLVYNKAPYITQDRCLTLSPLTDTVHSFSDTLPQALRYSAIDVIHDNYKMISTLNLKTATETYGYYYGFVVNNPNAKAYNIKRERYYASDNKISANAKLQAQRIVTESNANAFKVSVIFCDIMAFRIGDKVRLYDSLYKDNSLYISGIEYNVDSGGAFTKVTLMEQKYLT